MLIARILWLFIVVSGIVCQAQAADLPSVYPQVRSIFPDAEAYGGFEGTPPSVAVFKGGKPIGYIYLTEDVLRIPAYSGKPINTMVGMDLEGRIAGLAIVNHDEPILAVGITPERLNRYVAQYEGKSAFDKIVIGAKREGHVAIDGITGATITVMVENATVMRSARLVAEARGIRHPGLPVASGKDETAPAPMPAVVTPTVSPPETGSQPPQPARRPAVAAPAPAGNAAAAKKPAAPPRPVHGAVPLTSDFPPRNVAPLPARPGTWTPPQDEPAWIAIWQNRKFDIAVLVIGLATLSFILVFQDWLAKRPNTLIYVRNGFHVYTLFFIGWWGLAQLSVINVLTFVSSAMQGFRWENFLIDPMLFILWGFVAMTLLLWGRGVYCGWLCPFGALQELILLASRKLKLPEIEFSDAVHERLVALKYIILIFLFGVSLQSITEAAWYAEVEPFKTVISLRFQREWNYVFYALVLIGVAAVNRKFFCKYLCPLGAALAIPGRFRLFEWWLRRRKECGKPCQVCANQCSVRAVRPTGEINANECHYCLDCQVIYYNDKVCLPLIDRRKRREQQLVRGQEAKANNPVSTMVTSGGNPDDMAAAGKL
ncbi:MAG: 4Fe-4S binding protein [Rhodocyclales bacterium]|nr:4Fe-4S binding protein [Rhodocyclales bacterium]